MYTYGRKTGCRMSLDYTYKGMRIAYLENEAIRVGILLDKGADVFEFTYKPKDLDFMWQSPLEMRKPYVATSALAEGAFHDYYYGGWQEVLPSAGWASEPYMGVSQGLHGEASLLPFEATALEDTPEVGFPANPGASDSVTARAGAHADSGTGQGRPHREGAAGERVGGGIRDHLGAPSGPRHAVLERKLHCADHSQEGGGAGISPQRSVGARRRL